MRGPQRREEVAHHAQELVEPVVMQPVAGALDADDSGVAERLGAPDPTPRRLSAATRLA